MKRFSHFLWATLALFVLGCGPGGPSRYEVNGTVTYQDKPVETGAVQFIPDSTTDGPMCGANIENGRFHIDRSGGPLLGNYRISISATRKTGKKQRALMSGKEVDEYVDLGLPPKYTGGTSELRAKITADGPNEFAFDLK